MFWFLGLFIILLVFFYFEERSPSKRSGVAALGVDGELVFADQGRKSKSFVSTKYGLRAKPDFLIKLKDNRIAVVEYKNRSNDRIYLSDVVQVKSSVLAARAAYPVEVAFIKTKNKLQKVSIKQDSDELYREVERYVKQARSVSAGDVLLEYTTNINQCKSCSVRSRCMRFVKP